MTEKGNKVFHHALKVVPGLCTACTYCLKACPTEAIRVKPSSLSIEISAVQRQKEINRNRLGDELSETNILIGEIEQHDESYSLQNIFNGIRELTAFGSPNTL